MAVRLGASKPPDQRRTSAVIWTKLAFQDARANSVHKILHTPRTPQCIMTHRAWSFIWTKFAF